MSDENREKIVDFYEYCPTCKHEKLSEDDDPCYDCLNEPVNIDSRRPVNWEKK
jgi:hypothetical protein